MEDGYNLGRVSVLVIDGNKHMRIIISTILQGFGIRDILAVSDSASAYRELQKRPVDLVICALRLEPFNGLRFVKKLRTAQSSRDRFVPVLILTARSEMENVISAREAGVTEFMAKPVSPDKLYQHIANMATDPREFVETSNFFGPDRRRKGDASYKGPERRKRDLRKDGDDANLPQ